MKLKKTYITVLMAALSCLSAAGQPKTFKPTADMACTRGYMNIYVPSDGSFIMEVPRRVLGRDIMVSVSVIRGATRQERGSDLRYGYGGDQVYSTMIRLRRQGDRLNIEETLRPSVNSRQDTANIYRRYFANLLWPVEATLPVVAETDSSCFVNITELLSSDSKLFSLHGAASDLKIGAYRSERSEVTAVDAFPLNLNFRSTRSYSLAKPAKGELPESRWDIVSSWLLLPEVPMRPLIADKRVGYFISYVDGLTDNKNEMGNRTEVVQRWRLEPRPQDMARYLRGEAVEPAKPIIYYIDRDVPQWLVPWFKKAVEAWQPAFEKAGFKNAIRAELAPDDSTYVNGDLRYPLMSYKASPTPNAYGQLVVDPRSGEILSATVNIFQSVMGLLQRWYFVQCGAVDSRAREYPLPRDVMGELIATVVTHEVGHTLGLRHNFMASTCYHTDSMRSVSFVRRNLQGASVMDYQRFNYVAQPGDGFTTEDLLPKVGAYDDFAIEWAYRMEKPSLSPFEVKKLKSSWTDMKRKDRRVLYLEETNLTDPRVQSEDTGDDAVKAGRLGIENLKRDVRFLKTWRSVNDTDNFELRRRYLSTIQQYWNYINHPLRYVSGVYDDNAAPGERNMLVNRPVTRRQQLEVLKFLEDEFFNNNGWLFDRRLMDICGLDDEVYLVNESATAMGKLFLKYTKLKTNLQADPDGLTPDELFEYLYRVVYENRFKNTKLTRSQMMLQSSLLEQLTTNAESPANLFDNTGRKLTALIMRLKADAEKAAKSTSDYTTAAHYRTLVNFIKVWQAGANSGLKEN